MLLSYMLLAIYKKASASADPYVIIIVYFTTQQYGNVTCKLPNGKLKVQISDVSPNMSNMAIRVVLLKACFNRGI